MEIIFKFIWLAFIVITSFNILWIRSNSRDFIAKNPELKDGYNKMSKVSIILLNIPWLIVGIGNITGATNNMFDYFHPNMLNPAVLIFHGYIIILWVMSIFWIYFRNGAEFLELHPGLIRASNFKDNIYPTAKQIKLFFPLILTGALVGMIAMWVVNIPAPAFK